MAEVTIKGVRSLARKLRDMPGPVRQATMQAVEDAAREIVNTMKNLVPVRRGALRDSINYSWGDVPKNVLVLAKSVPIGGHTLTIFAGNETAYYARWIEFGTQPHSLGGERFHPGTSAQPFFYPAFRAHKKEAKRKVNAAVRKAIKQVAARGGANV